MKTCLYFNVIFFLYKMIDIIIEVIIYRDVCIVKADTTEYYRQNKKLN